MTKTIGFFGDSFCEYRTHPHCIENNYETYIQKVVNYFNFDLVQLGEPGSSIWDLYFLQFDKFIKNDNIPDICVFSWTSHNRLYHPTVRNITAATLSFLKPNRDIKLIWNAASLYYQHLFNEEKHLLEYVSFLYYFDNHILSKLTESSKFIHLWSFDDMLYSWNNGIEIKPSLSEVATFKNDNPEYYGIPNHISGELRNQIVFECIKDAINNYGKINMYNLNSYV